MVDIIEKEHQDLHSMVSKLVNLDTQEQQLHQKLLTLTKNFFARAYGRCVDVIIRC